MEIGILDKMNKVLIILLIFLGIPKIISQEKTNFLYIHGDDTNYVPYMYLNSDTLDYSDGGTIEIALYDLSIKTDKIYQEYVISGNLITKYGEKLDGFVTTGKINEIKAVTWIGFTQTGLLCSDRTKIFTQQGKFMIKIPFYYTGNIIFSAVGGFTVMSIPIEEFIKDNLLY